VKQVQTQKQTEQLKENLSEQLTLCLSQLKDQCAAEIREFIKFDGESASQTLSRMWDSGRRLASLQRDDFKRTADGTKAVNVTRLLSEATGRTEEWLNKARLLFQAFTSAAARKTMLGYRMAKSGKPLTYEHYERLMPLLPKDASGDRSAFDDGVNRTLANDWTPDQVTIWIRMNRERAGQPAARGGGRPVCVPPTLQGKMVKASTGIGGSYKYLHTLCNSESHNLLHSVKDMAQEKVAEHSEEIIHLASQLKSVCKTTVELLNEKLITDVDEVISYVQKCSTDCSQEASESEVDSLELADAAKTKRPDRL
jgi:hypothetical protein